MAPAAVCNNKVCKSARGFTDHGCAGGVIFSHSARSCLQAPKFTFPVAKVEISSTCTAAFEIHGLE
jgi:hypothetical protein